MQEEFNRQRAELDRKKEEDRQKLEAEITDTLFKQMDLRRIQKEKEDEENRQYAPIGQLIYRHNIFFFFFYFCIVYATHTRSFFNWVV